MGVQLFNRMMGAGKPAWLQAAAAPGAQAACREQGSISAKSLPVANAAIPPTSIVAESPAPTVGKLPLVKHGMDVKNPSVPAKTARSTISAAEMLQKELEAAKTKTAPTSEHVTEAKEENTPAAPTTSKAPPQKKGQQR